MKIKFDVFLFFVTLNLFQGNAENFSNNHPHRHLFIHCTNKFTGNDLVSSLGGTNGKYFRHCHLFFITKTTSLANIKLLAKKEGVPRKLYVHFIANSDSIINGEEALLQLKSLAKFLKTTPKANLILKGNTGTNEDDTTAPLGSGRYVLNYPAKLNGKDATTADLMKARANAIKKILTITFNIGAKRIETKAGEQTQGAAGRNVGVEIMK